MELALSNLWKKIGFTVTFTLLVLSGTMVLYTISIWNQGVAANKFEEVLLSNRGYYFLAFLGLTIVMLEWAMEEFGKLFDDPSEPVALHDIGGDEYRDIPTFLEPDRLQALRDRVGR